MRQIRTFLTLASEQGLRRALLETAKYFVPQAHVWLALIREELGEDTDLSIVERAALLRRGYLSHCHYLYGFSDGTLPEDYMSEFTQAAHTGTINGDNSVYLDDKLKFNRLLRDRGHGDLVPKVFGVIRGGEFHADEASTDVTQLLRREGRLVIKDNWGRWGAEVLLCESTGGGVRIGDREIGLEELRDRVRGLDGYLVTEYCAQAAYSEELFPGSANTIRVMTLRSAGGDPFIPIAVHRIGNRPSQGMDNFSLGGFSAEIDLDTGTLGPAVRYPSNGEMPWYSVHPDSSATIEGRTVPGWSDIRERLLEVASDLPELEYVGWDLLVTGPAEFVLLEGNNQSDVRLLQVHRPLLADDRVRSFYERHGVV